MTSDIEKIFLARGVKMTDQRKVIAKVISEANDHPHAEELYMRASQIDSKISLATVYRTINLLEEHKIIEKLEFGEGKARYEFKKCEDKHHHLIDINSGTVIEFYDQELEIIQEKIAKKLGYKLIGHSLRLFGVKIENGMESGTEDK